MRALVIRIRHNGDARGAARRTRGRRVERSGAEPSGGRSPPLCAPSVNAMRAVTVRRASDADWSGAFASPLFALLCFAPRLHKLRTNLLLLIQCTVLHVHCTVCAAILHRYSMYRTQYSSTRVHTTCVVYTACTEQVLLLSANRSCRSAPRRNRFFLLSISALCSEPTFGRRQLGVWQCAHSLETMSCCALKTRRTPNNGTRRLKIANLI